MNTINLIGRLTRDPGHRVTDNGRDITKFHQAVPRRKVARSQNVEQLHAVLNTGGAKSHTRVLALPPGAGDLSAWRQESGACIQDELALRLESPRPVGQALRDTRIKGGAPELRASDAIHKIGVPSLAL
ncbi:MAG TPA: hypothetical protein VGV93_11715 [Acidimicrobiales bacterium]|nr:hypothetical protein [Acidimicrobiales bacterium]